MLKKIIVVFCMSFLCTAFAMQELTHQDALTLIAGTAGYEDKSETLTKWHGELNNGKSINIDVFHKTRRTRHTKITDTYHVVVKGRIGKKRLSKEQAEQWYRCLSDSCPASFVFELN